MILHHHHHYYHQVPSPIMYLGSYTTLTSLEHYHRDYNEVFTLVLCGKKQAVLMEGLQLQSVGNLLLQVKYSGVASNIKNLHNT